ncbi:hypothetical protein ON010_g7627 [Phytophthora cinnamomi]|nr:hypothetical protein ON010_g7627 [Phytophthora cinnamomi]
MTTAPFTAQSTNHRRAHVERRRRQRQQRQPADAAAAAEPARADAAAAARAARVLAAPDPGHLADRPQRLRLQDAPAAARAHQEDHEDGRGRAHDQRRGARALRQGLRDVHPRAQPARLDPHGGEQAPHAAAQRHRHGHHQDRRLRLPHRHRPARRHQARQEGAASPSLSVFSFLKCIMLTLCYCFLFLLFLGPDGPAGRVPAAAPAAASGDAAAAPADPERRRCDRGAVAQPAAAAADAAAVPAHAANRGGRCWGRHDPVERRSAELVALWQRRRWPSHGEHDPWRHGDQRVDVRPALTEPAQR